MMTSDSEDDYEDANQSQHHDNQVENIVQPFSPPSSSSNNLNLGNSSQLVREGSEAQPCENRNSEAEVNTDEAARVSPREPEVAGNDLAGQPEVENVGQVEAREGGNQGVDEDEDIVVVAGIPREFLRRLRGFMNDNLNPNILVVDSDSDDAGTESEGSEMDFPMLNPDNDGESEYSKQIACSLQLTVA
ncbi:unnamed protein product [Orchesella dallaii]|uniref:Uncharacterized protein n=1 Tax=Orchesella dallaii TaxID=48710 RepID=A0ABP1Q4N8_9HEXA